MKLVIQVFVTVHFSPEKAPGREPPESQRWQSPAANPLQPVCPACGWSKIYTNIRSARNGLAGHKQHCPGTERRVSEFARPFVPGRS